MRRNKRIQYVGEKRKEKLTKDYKDEREAKKRSGRNPKSIGGNEKKEGRKVS